MKPGRLLWLVLPLLLLTAFTGGAAPAGLAVGFVLLFVGPLLGGLIMLRKGRSVLVGMIVAFFLPVIGHAVLLDLRSRR